MYKLATNARGVVTGVIRFSDQAFIPFSSDNTDYQTFKQQINADEAQLQDADGNVMTQEEATAFVGDLP